MQRPLLSLLAAALSAMSFAGSPISWRFGSTPAADGSVQVTLRAICEEGWHIYALTLPRDDGPLPTSIRITPASTHEPNGPVVEPKPVEVQDPNFQMLVRYHGHEAEFIVPVKRLSSGAFTVEGEVEFMSCNDQMCLPPEVVKFSVPVPAVK